MQVNEAEDASRIIRDITEGAGLSDSIGTQAVSIHKQAIDDGFNRVGDGRELPAAVYAAARINEVPVKPRALANQYGGRVKADDVVSDMRRLIDRLPFDIPEPEGPKAYVEDYCTELDVSDQFRETALSVCERAVDAGTHSGKSPSGFAAAVVYAVAYLLDAPIRQDDVAEASGVSPVTIRNQYRDIIAVGFDDDVDVTSPGDRDAIEDTIDRILDAVDGVPEVVRTDAKAIAANLPDEQWVERTDPKGVAAGVVYVAAKDNRVSLSQDYVGDVAGVSKGTVISRVKDIRAWRGEEAAVEARREALGNVSYNRLKELAAENDVDVGATPARDDLIDRLAQAGVDGGKDN